MPSDQLSRVPHSSSILRRCRCRTGSPQDQGLPHQGLLRSPQRGHCQNSRLRRLRRTGDFVEQIHAGGRFGPNHQEQDLAGGRVAGIRGTADLRATGIGNWPAVADRGREWPWNLPLHHRRRSVAPSKTQSFRNRRCPNRFRSTSVKPAYLQMPSSAAYQTFWPIFDGVPR